MALQAQPERPVMTENTDQIDGLDGHVLQRSGRSTAESAAWDRHETAELVRLERKLMAEFGESVGPETVMSCIADALTRFAGARVRIYVMLLVEREATEDLRARALQASTPV